MKMKRCFLLPSFVTSRTVRYNTFINHNITLILEKFITLYPQVNLEKNVFFIKNIYASIFNFIHNIIYQKFIQNTFFYNIFFTKSIEM